MIKCKHRGAVQPKPARQPHCVCKQSGDLATTSSAWLIQQSQLGRWLAISEGFNTLSLRAPAVGQQSCWCVRVWIVQHACSTNSKNANFFEKIHWFFSSLLPQRQNLSQILLLLLKWTLAKKFAMKKVRTFCKKYEKLEVPISYSKIALFPPMWVCLSDRSP